MAIPDPVFGADELMALITRQFADYGKVPIRIESVSAGKLTMRFLIDSTALRPGGTVSGPSQMTAADTASFLIVQAHIGEKAFAVTSDLHMRFLRKPANKDLIVEASLLRLGRRLAVVECLIYSEGDDDPVASASVSYMIPTP